MEKFTDDQQVEAYLSNQFAKLQHQKRHPWRLVTLATVTEKHAIQRTVVVRKSNWRHRNIRFYTDARSAKMKAILSNAPTAFLFYHARHQVQLRFTATPIIVGEQERQQIWSSLPAHATKDYSTAQAPGTPLLSDEEYVPTTAAGYKNFCAIDNQFEQVEVLQLHREGHRRVLLSWVAKEERWKGQWLVP